MSHYSNNCKRRNTKYWDYLENKATLNIFGETTAYTKPLSKI